MSNIIKLKAINWMYVSTNNNDEDKSIDMIFILVHKLFVEIFGKQIMTNEYCEVFNDPNAECPMLITNLPSLRLRLNVPSYTIWNQLVYQLSHELCHYAIRQQKVNKELYVNWFEETLCEAMSLYLLDKIVLNWSQCYFVKGYPFYYLKIRDYKNNAISKVSDSALEKCSSIDTLREINETCSIDEEHRQLRSKERNFVYNLFCKYPKDINKIVEYSNYIKGQSKLEIDFDKWNSNDNAFLNKLQQIHPKIT